MFKQSNATQRLATVAAATLAGIASAQVGLEGHFAPGRWDDTGITQGTTNITEIVELHYDVVDPNPADGVSFRTCQFTAVATSTGMIRVVWDARYRHSSWEREFVLWAIVDGPGGVQSIPLVLSYDANSPDISPDFHGVVDLHVTQGFGYGFQMGGSHFTFDQNLNGNLVFWAAPNSTAPLENDPSKWSKTGILDGTTGVRPALRLEYNVNTPGGGVPERTTDLTALPALDGITTFDWTFEGDNAYFQAAGLLSLFAETDQGENVIPLVNQPTSGPYVLRGRSSIDFEAGKEIGLRIGGRNNDALNFIRGNLILSRFEAQQQEQCLADVNEDGLLDFFDVQAFLQAYSDGCP
jgi:hypothetical protein